MDVYLIIAIVYDRNMDEHLLLLGLKQLFTTRSTEKRRTKST